jgi:hypothetical protein
VLSHVVETEGTVLITAWQLETDSMPCAICRDISATLPLRL